MAGADWIAVSVVDADSDVEGWVARPDAVLLGLGGDAVRCSDETLRLIRLPFSTGLRLAWS
jgi:hypothetical protein